MLLDLGQYFVFSFFCLDFHVSYQPSFSDLFYTRMFPSKMFDVLKDDFDHYLIGGAVLALAIAALITRKLAQKKALKQAWK